MNRRELLKSMSLTVGWAVCPSIISGVLSGCESAFRPDYKPVTLSLSQDRMVSTLVELIIPATDTPGAKAAKVNQFIDLMLSRYLKDDEKKKFLGGLDRLDKRSQDTFGNLYVDISEQNQVELLQELEEESMVLRQKGNRSDTFFTLLKELTIAGYYTSEIGASQELRYVHFAGRYAGDVPYSSVGKAYS